MRPVRGSWENTGKIGGWLRDCVVSALERGRKEVGKSRCMDTWEVETTCFADALDVGDDGNLDGGHISNLSKWLNSTTSY